MQTSNLIDCNSNFYGYRLLNTALEGFFYFDDDEIENKLDWAETFFGDKVAVRNYIWSCKDLRNKICEIGKKIYDKSAKH